MAQKLVIKPRVKSEKTAIDTLLGNVHYLSSWFHTKTGPNSAEEFEEKDIVLTAKYFKLEFRDERKACIVVGYNNGFQLWDLSFSEPPHNNITELLSVKCGRVRVVHPLQRPLEPDDESQPFAGKRPILALVFDEEPSPHMRFPPNRLSFYSLLEGFLSCHQDFETPLYEVKSNRHVIAVVGVHKIWLLDARSLARLNTIECFASRDATASLGVCALGSRWLAYQSPHLPTERTSDMTTSLLMPTASRESPTGSAPDTSAAAGTGLPASPSVKMTSPTELFSVARDSVRGAAKDVLYRSVKTLDRFTASPSSGSNKSSAVNGTSATVFGISSSVSASVSSSESVPGIICIIDILTFETIAHFKAHAHPISTLAFDPTGTLLVTASERGNDVNVFRIQTGQSPLRAHRHIYTLERGITSAIIKDVSFSRDSKLLAFTSMHGTTHVYGVTVTGVEVTADTHLDERHERPFNPVQYEMTSPPEKPTKPDRLCLIHIASNNYDAPLAVSFSGISFFMHRENEDYVLFVLSKQALLSKYRLSLYANEQQPLKLMCKSVAELEWDLQRRTKWPSRDFRPPRKSLSSDEASTKTSPHANVDERTKWLANVETAPFRSSRLTEVVPFWCGPQFRLVPWNSAPETQLPAEEVSSERLPTVLLDLERISAQTSHYIPPIYQYNPLAPAVSSHPSRSSDHARMSLQPAKSKGSGADTKEVPLQRAVPDPSQAVEISQRALSPSSPKTNKQRQRKRGGSGLKGNNNNNNNNNIVAAPHNQNDSNNNNDANNYNNERKTSINDINSSEVSSQSTTMSQSELLKDALN